jgi:hypothetical protein
MPDLIDAIRKEIDARLEELRPLAREASDPSARARRTVRLPLASMVALSGTGQRTSPRRSRSTRGDVGARTIDYVTVTRVRTARDVASRLDATAAQWRRGWSSSLGQGRS